MSVYLKVVPAVMLEPDILLALGRKITSLVRDSLILDRRMEEICSSIEREGRTLDRIIIRNNDLVSTGEVEEAAIACEKSCSLLKTAVGFHFLRQDPDHLAAIRLLYPIFEKPARISQKNAYSLSSERIRDIIDNLDTIEAREALSLLHLDAFYEDLKHRFDRFASMLASDETFSASHEHLPTLRSSIALYGMLLDTLIANVRFENYQLLHRVESILSKIETILSEGITESVERQRLRDSVPAGIVQALT